MIIFVPFCDAVVELPCESFVCLVACPCSAIHRETVFINRLLKSTRLFLFHLLLAGTEMKYSVC